MIQRNVKKPTWRPKSGHNDKYKTTAAQLFLKTSLRELMPFFPFVSPKPFCSEPHHTPTLCCSVFAVVCCYHLVGVARKSLKDETTLRVDVLQELRRYTLGLGFNHHGLKMAASGACNNENNQNSIIVSVVNRN